MVIRCFLHITVRYDIYFTIASTRCILSFVVVTFPKGFRIKGKVTQKVPGNVKYPV